MRRAPPTPPRPQPPGATYAAKLTREDGRIDWTRPAAAIARRIRALNPWPGTFTGIDGTTLKILAARAEAGTPPAAPGTVLDDRLAIACGEGILRPLRLQLAGRAALATADFLRGHPLPPGSRLG